MTLKMLSTQNLRYCEWTLNGYFYKVYMEGTTNVVALNVYSAEAMHEYQKFYLRSLYAALASEQLDEAMALMLTRYYSCLHYFRKQTSVSEVYFV